MKFLFKKHNSLLPSLLFYSRPSDDKVRPIHSVEDGWTTQFISLNRNLKHHYSHPQNNVWPNICTFYGPVKFIDKIITEQWFLDTSCKFLWSLAFQFGSPNFKSKCFLRKFLRPRRYAQPSTHKTEEPEEGNEKSLVSAAFIFKSVMTVLTSGTLKEMISFREHSTVAREWADCVWPPRVVLCLDIDYRKTN